MPGKVKVKIISGKNLPVMDRSSDTTDAYVEIKLGNTTYKTDVCRRTLHPHWNTDWYRFEVDDSELQDEPLQIRLMDHDTYSANDAIGKVYLNLNPLLLPVAGQLVTGDNNPHHEISGWIPVYDTMHGIRGEVNVTVKASNILAPTVPQGYQAKIINGFVEELIVNDDPEYQWIDKIRTPRASNEARQTLFFKLSGELQRKIGVKALNLGGNAVIGYKQSFDLEGESGIVARGIGTAVTLVKSFNIHHVVVESKEEDIQNYLKFVGDGTSFRLCSASPAHEFHCPFIPFKPFAPFDTTSIITRVPKLVSRQYVSLDSDVLGSSISNPNLQESDRSSIQVLLNQEDKRGESAMTRRFQKFKHSQKSLSKKMIALKAKLNDSIGEEADEDLPSATHDKRRYFKRTSSDSSAMAEILARSVIQATSSLSCILENQNIPKDDDTMQKLEPIANLLSKTESQTSVIDDNASIASDAQSYSSSDSSSSGSDYDYKYYGKSSNDVETLSNIISNVERLQRCLSREGLHKQYSMPAIPTKGFSLSSLDSIGKFENSSVFNEYKSKEELFIRPQGFEAKSASIDTFSENLNELSLGDDEDKNMSQLKTVEVGCNELSHSRTSIENLHSHPKGIVKTALQTMLLDRVHLLGTPTKELTSDDITFPTSPECKQAALTTHDCSQRGALNCQQDFKIETPIDAKKENHNKDNLDHSYNFALPNENVDLRTKDTISTTIETMVFEKVNILETVADCLIGNTKVQNELQKDKEGSVTTDFKTSECKSGEQESIAEKECKDTQATGERSHAPLSETNTQGLFTISTPEEIKVIAPVSTENISIQPKRMVKTAMQTMLLEKVNLLGTYTPPTSPTLSMGSPNVERKKRFTFNEPKLSVKKTNIPKSYSSASFDEHHRQRKKDTVLGMPFTSLSSLTSEYEKCFKKDRMSCFSDSHLHKPMMETLKEKDSARKKRFKFLHIKTGINNNNSNHSKTSMFNKLLKHSKKSIPEDLQKEGVKEHHQNILSRMFHLRHEEKSIKDEETQTSNEILNPTVPFQISETNQTPSNTSKTEIPLPKPPSNTDIASGDLLAHNKTKLACITSNRHNSLPAQDKQEHRGGDKKNEHSPDSVVKITQSPAKVSYMVPLHRRSSDSDLSITPKGNSLTGSDRSVGNTAAYFMRNNCIRRGLLNQENFEMLEYPFLTMTKFSPRFIVQIGGSVSARSVKLVERILNPEEPESRDTWWSEIRMEIRSHARSLNCNAVLGYTELTSICEDVCVLSACGTAAVVDLNYSMSDDDILIIQRNLERDKNLNGHHRSSHDSPDHREHSLPLCTVTHLPYDEKTVLVKAKATKCPLCLKGRVPEVLIATIEPTESIPIVGKGCFIESYVTRPLKDLRGDTTAKEISDGLPFLEYELHRLLVNKLKIRGMNAIFSLKVRITVGEKMLIGVATGTAVYLSPLPTPDLPMLVTNRVSDEKIVADLQEMLKETVKKNREIYQIKDDSQDHRPMSDDDSDEEQAVLDISCGNKDCCILELDDPEDAEVLNFIMEEKIPDGFHVVSTESVPGLEDLEIVKNLQMFTQIYRAKMAPPYNLQKHFVRLLQSVYFKLRRMVPCALCDLQFRVDLPEPDEIQLCVIGMALGLGKKVKKAKVLVVPKKPEEDLMFKLDEDPQESSVSLICKSTPSSLKYRGHRSPSKYKAQTISSNERHGVDITPLSYVPGGNIEQYLGNLNFFFIRETTSIREEGGLSGFIHSFVTEVLAIVRSHVTALGGNALVAFFMTECVLNHNLHKNQEDSETTDLHDFQAQQREVNISTDPTSCDDGSSTSQSTTPTSSRLIAPQPKRKKNVNPTDNMIQLAEERLKQIRPDDEFDAYGKYVAYKLRSLKGKQAVFARKLMNDVIFEGELEALTKDFKVINMQSHHSDQRNDYQQFNPHLYPPTHISQMPDHQLSHSQAYPQQYNPRSSSNNSQTLYSQTLIHANNSEQSNSQQLNTQQPESQHLVNINANEANNKNITTYFSRFSP